MSTTDPGGPPNPPDAPKTHPSQTQDVHTESTPSDVEGDPLLFLNQIFDNPRSVSDLPKGHFHLDQDELDEESAEVSVLEFLQHYHTVADHLE